MKQYELPKPLHSLSAIFTELKSINNERLDDKNDQNDQQEEIKGLKFISNRLAKLFDKNKRLQYSQITKILIDNFASESNDSRNIKRRVYDAINVMIAAEVFQKNSDFIEKIEHPIFMDAVKNKKKQLSSQIKEKKNKIAIKMQKYQRIKNKLEKTKAIFKRNEQLGKNTKKIYRPCIIKTSMGIKQFKLDENSQTRNNALIVLQSNNLLTSRKGKKQDIVKMDEGQYIQFL